VQGAKNWFELASLRGGIGGKEAPRQDWSARSQCAQQPAIRAISKSRVSELSEEKAKHRRGFGGFRQRCEVASAHFDRDEILVPRRETRVVCSREYPTSPPQVVM
jgi:hypothetical protein